LPPNQLVLGFDTSAAHCAAALLSGEQVLAQRCEEMTKGQAERLFPLLEEMLASASAGWSDLARIGVGIGPGNFTGTRISVAAARGLALSLNIPAIGVSSFAALALELPRPLIACVDGRAGRVYVQDFASDGASAPITVTGSALPDDLLTPAHGVTGFNATAIAARAGAKAHSPIYPLAVAIGLIAARATPDGHRPAPLYMRPADAAPARGAPPVILP
jgi:tRNA threonylcarbamoyladenosine biosynthesis protein TsaB